MRIRYGWGGVNLQSIILAHKSNGSRIYSLVLLRNGRMDMVQTLSRLRATRAQTYSDEIFLIIQNFTEIIDKSSHGKVSM